MTFQLMQMSYGSLQQASYGSLPVG
jgi:hypothetical protein